MSTEVEILLFARAPVLGAVKSRLAATLGAETALAVYRILAEKQMTEIVTSGLPCTVWTTPDSGRDSVTRWLAPARDVLLQPEGDLGKRLSHACDEAFGRDVRGVILVGTDCPDLDASRLRRLASLVSIGQCAIQPAFDGGYVALGLSGPCPEAFQGVDWGTERVCAQTIERFRGAGQDPIVLDALLDVDHREDWARVASRFPPVIESTHITRSTLA